MNFYTLTLGKVSLGLDYYRNLEPVYEVLQFRDRVLWVSTNRNVLVF